MAILNKKRGYLPKVRNKQDLNIIFQYAGVEAANSLRPSIKQIAESMEHMDFIMKCETFLVFNEVPLTLHIV